MRLFFGILLITLGVTLFLASFVFYWHLFGRKVDREPPSTFVSSHWIPENPKEALLLGALFISGILLVGAGASMIT
jgi:hypothetical protein